MSGENAKTMMAANQREVHDLVLAVLTARQPDPAGSGGGSLELFSTVEGLLDVIATLAEGSGAFSTARDRREFAEECRKGLTGKMRAVRERIEADPASTWSIEHLGGLN